MNAIDIIELSQDAFLIVRGAHVVSANQAAESLFRQCGRQQPLPGASLDELWEACEAGGEPHRAVTRVRMRASVGVAPLLELAQTPRDASDAEYAIRMRKATPQPDPAADGESSDRQRPWTAEQAATQARLELFQAVMDNSADALIIIDRQSMRYLAANQSALRWAGLSHEQLMAVEPHELAWKGATLSELEAEYDAVIASSPQPRVSFAWHKRTDGSRFPSEKTRTALKVAGRWVVIISMRDITERHAAQYAAERFRAAIDASGDAIVLVCPESATVVDANEAALALNGAALQDEPAAYRQVVQMHPQIEVAETRIQRPDGSWLDIERRRSAFETQNGWLVVVAMRDITERKAAERGLELFQTAMDSSLDALAIVDRASMRYVAANQTIVRWSGLTHAQFMALDPYERAWVGAAREELEAEYDRVIAMSPQPRVTIEYRERRDGSVFPSEVVRVGLKVKGNWVIALSVRDITDRMTDQRKLDLLNTAVNEAADAIVVLDPRELAYIHVNEAAARVLGISREELMRLGPVGFAQAMGFAADADAVRAVYAEPIAMYPQPVTSVRTATRNGQVLVFESTRRAVRLGDAWLVIAVQRDITERHMAMRRQERLVAALNESAEGIYVSDPVTMRYVDVNEAAARFFGMSRDEMLRVGPVGTNRLLGLGSESNLPAYFQELIACHPEIKSGIGSVQPPGAAAPTMLEYTRRAVCVDGGWLILTVSRDVTERVATQRRLEQLRAAVNEATDMVMVIDPIAMEFVEFNEATARQFGLSRELMLERGMAWVVRHLGIWTPEELGELFAGLIARYPASRTEVAPFIVKGMPDKVIESTLRAVQMEGQWLIINVGRDVTERVRAEEELGLRMQELSRSNRELEQFAYVTSHDLSEPLRMVASYTQLLARRYAGKFDGDAREFMDYIVGGAQRMKRMIDDLLLYSRAGRVDPALREWPLDKLLDEALKNLSHAIGEANARIERPAALPALACDQSGLTQVFQNLVANAIKFRGDAPPVIRIEATRADGDWTVSVTDNGIGILPAYFDRIFVLFQRLHAQSAYEGTGMGLSICKKIIERHGGSIWVESAPGQGACFKFRLPGYSRFAVRPAS